MNVTFFGFNPQINGLGEMTFEKPVFFRKKFKTIPFLMQIIFFKKKFLKQESLFVLNLNNFGQKKQRFINHSISFGKKYFGVSWNRISKKFVFSVSSFDTFSNTLWLSGFNVCKVDELYDHLYILGVRVS